jgi:hypothetical protein
MVIIIPVDVIAPSTGVPWTIDDSNSCVNTFRSEQTLIIIIG